MSLKCFHVSHLCAFFKWCCVLHLRAGLPQKKFWFRIFAHRVFIFTSCFFVPLISAPSLPIGLCLTLCLLVKLSLRQEGGGGVGWVWWVVLHLSPPPHKHMPRVVDNQRSFCDECSTSSIEVSEALWGVLWVVVLVDGEVAGSGCGRV